MKPGIYYDMPASEYHAAPGVSNSKLSDAAVSMYHYWAMHINPERPARIDTPAMSAGTLAHCAVLEPREFARRYVVTPADAPKRPTASQWAAKNPSSESVEAMKWWTDFEEQSAGKIMIGTDARDVAKNQRSAVAAVPELREILSNGHAEVSVFWVDEKTGLLCKCRVDFLSQRRAFDLKTAADAEPSAFARSVAKYGYHRQAAHYMNGLAAAGVEVDGFTFGVVSSSYPFVAYPATLGEEAEAQGFDEVAELLEKIAACERSGIWPAFGPGYQVIELPMYARRSTELEIGYV